VSLPYFEITPSGKGNENAETFFMVRELTSLGKDKLPHFCSSEVSDMVFLDDPMAYIWHIYGLWWNCGGWFFIYTSFSWGKN
jgi:hypothetical protein